MLVLRTTKLCLSSVLWGLLLLSGCARLTESELIISVMLYI